jgi:putative heme-binding domain-containing protein
LGSGDPNLERTALDVVSRHKDWAGEIVGLLRERLADRAPTAERLAALGGVLAAFSGDAAVQHVVADVLARPETAPATRVMLLEVMTRAEARTWPEAWAVPVERSVGSADAREVGQAIAAAAASRLRRFDGRLHALAADAGRPLSVRVSAAAALAGGGGPLTPEVFRLLAEQCGAKADPVQRLAAARALVAAQLDAAQRRQLAGMLAQADPLLLPVLADALEKDGDMETGRTAVDALAKAPGLGNLSAARLERLLAHYPAEVRRAAEPLVKRLRAKNEAQLERLDELKRLVLTGGDTHKGRQVFHDRRALCITCHRVGNEGEGIGPDLSRIGATRTPADLLEAIVVPNASFARGFEPYVVTTAGGKLYAGIISRQTADAVYLRQADRSEVRIDRGEIEELAPGKESIMPQGLDRTLTVEELRDLVAYLASLNAEAR